MRYCGECGQQIEEGKRFCKRCGAPIPSPVGSEPKEMPYEEPEKQGGLGKKLGIGLAVILVLLLAGGVGFAVFYFSSSEKLERSLLKNDWQTAGMIYSEMTADGDSEKAETAVSKTLEQIKEKYTKRELTKEEALEKCAGIREINNYNPELDELISYISNLELSREAFELAEQYWTDEDYANAILQYQLVQEIDENYETAKERIQEGEAAYKEEVLQELNQLAEDGDDEEYNNVFYEAQGILGSDSDLNEAFAQKTKKDLADQIEEFEKEENYREAVCLLLNQEEVVQADSDLQIKLDQLSGKYKEQVLSQAAKQAEDGDYDAAGETVQDGLSVLAEDEDLAQELEKYESCRPVGLENLRVLDNASSDLKNKYSEQSIEDLYGNLYEGYIDLSRTFRSENYIKFLVDGKYTNFKGTFFVPPNWTGKAKLVIYADEKEIYSSGFMNRESRAIDFDLSIKHAESITVKAVVDQNYNAICMILTNAKVYKTLE